MIRVEAFPAPQGPLDLEATAGELLLLEGPNGCGKTSLLRALAGLESSLRPRRAEDAGEEPARLPARRLCGLVHLATQDPRDGLVGLTVAGEFRLRGLDLPESLGGFAHRDVATLSSGEARRVALAVAAAQRAPVLLLDEPTSGLDAAGQEWLRALLDEARGRGVVVAADPSGLLSGLEARRVALAPASAGAAPAWGPAPEGPTLLSCGAATVARGESRVATPGVDLGPGLHAVTGPNGSGKSTLLLRLAGLVDPPASRMATGPPRLLLPRARDLLGSASVAQELGGVEAWFRRLLVPEGLEARHPLTLSGGEAQRVALAKCLGRPGLPYLLDEPEAHLDGAGRAALVSALARRRAEGAVLVMASHDPELVGLADSTLAVGAA